MPRSKVSVGSVPDSATAGGAQNNDLDETARTGKSGSDKAQGPKIGDRGQYLPAAYEVGGGVTRIDR